MGSGRQGIHAALRMLNISAGDEIIMPAFICASAGDAVIRNGATPVFADVGDKDVNLNPDIIESLINPKTRAILAAHIFGVPAQIDKIIAIAAKYKIPVIEDCCQSFGAKYKNRITGTWGDIGIFSFGISKNLSASGGGAICFQEALSEVFPHEILKRANFITGFRRLLTICATPMVFNQYVYKYLDKPISSYSQRKNSASYSNYEYAMNRLEAAIITQQLNRYESIKKLRNDNAEIYRTYFKNRLDMIDVPKESEPAFLYFPVFHKRAKELKRRLRQDSIEVQDKDSMLFFALYEHPGYSGFRKSALSKVEIMENEYLVFPVGHSRSETEYICQKTLKILQTI
jgi:dTDP-4-amino-4,6-dideoxygalactose transaminase